MSGFHDYTVFDDGMLWNASMELLRYIESEVKDIQSKRILELGSGLGHLGLGLADLGADVTLTEHPAIVDRLKKRVKDYCIANPGKRARALELEWGGDGWERSLVATEKKPYDIVISAELLGVVDYHDALLWTMEKLAHKDLTIYSVFCDRPFSFMFFAKMADTNKFNVRPIAFRRDQEGSTDDNDDAGINMHVITCK